MRALAILVLAVGAAGCPRGGGGGARAAEPLAEPVPAQLDWPDAAERLAPPDAGVAPAAP